MRKKNHDCFPHDRGVFHSLSTIVYLTEVIPYYYGANRRKNRINQQNVQ